MKALVLDAREQLRRTVDRQLRQQYDDQAAGIAREMARKEVFKANEQFAEDFDACVLYALHEVCGFGRVRLTRFFHRYKELRGEVLDRYQFADGNADFTWWATRELHRIGVDMDELRREDKED